MRCTRVVSLAALAALCLIAAAQAAAPAASAERPLRLGCVAFTKESTARSFEALRAYLADRVPPGFALTVYPGYQEIIHDLLNDNLEAALLTPIVYLNAGGVRPLHTLAYGVYRANGAFTYRSTILVPAKSKARTLKDLAGKRMAYVDLMSASGYLVPKEALKTAGVVGRRDVKGTFYGNHVDSVMAVLDGKADAAATYDIVFADSPRLERERRNLRVLWTSDSVIPADAFVTTDKVAPEARRRIRAALLSYFASQDGGKTPSNEIYEGFVPGDPNLYGDLRAFLERVAAR